jgi:hypothetical protein
VSSPRLHALHLLPAFRMMRVQHESLAT